MFNLVSKVFDVPFVYITPFTHSNTTQVRLACIIAYIRSVIPVWMAIMMIARNGYFFVRSILYLSLLSRELFCTGSVELAAVGVSAAVFNLVSKVFNVPLLNITTSFVAEEQALIGKGEDSIQNDNNGNLFMKATTL